MDFLSQITETIAAAVPDMPPGDIKSSLETPPSADMGDYAFPCFRLAKVYKKSPAMIAEELSVKVAGDTFTAKPAGGYLNFYIDKTAFAKAALDTELKTDAYKGVTIVMDYSSPNIAKPFHVAHVPTTVIGAALYNIYKSLGADVIGINHLGDWGTQFGKLITAYKKWGDDTQTPTVAELSRLYVLFHEKVEQDPSLDDEARAWLVKMERGDEEALRLWRMFSDISLAEYKDNTYKRLGIDFDYYTGESFYNDKMDAVAEELSEKGLLKESAGARIVDLEAYNMPPCLILRSDGGTLYPTRDIAAALYRKKTYDFDKCLYLTCMDQNLHFAQWFKVIELMGYDWAAGLVHIPLGQISFAEGKLSTRKGNVILLDDLLNEAVARTRAIIEEKNPTLGDKDAVAEAVGIGAVIFNNMYYSRIKDVSFSWDRALNFEGESGPYVQYTHARCCGILEKSGGQPPSDGIGGNKPSVADMGGNKLPDACRGGSLPPVNIDYNLLTDEHSIAVLRLIYRLPGEIKDAADKYEPYILSRALVDICQAFNKFYNNNIVLTDDTNLRAARLALVSRVARTLKYGLSLMNIKAPERM